MSLAVVVHFDWKGVVGSDPSAMLKVHVEHGRQIRCHLPYYRTLGQDKRRTLLLIAPCEAAVLKWNFLELAIADRLPK